MSRLLTQEEVVERLRQRSDETSMRELARETGVSASMLSRLINVDGVVLGQWAAQRLGYDVVIRYRPRAQS